MQRLLRTLPAVALLVTAIPFTAQAHSAAATTCPTPKTHKLPSGAASTTVFSFGTKGGSMRPWNVKIGLDGSIAATTVTADVQTLPDAKNSVQALLTLADANGFWSMKKAVGCLGGGVSPDVSTRFISIHTSSGTKRVDGFGSCTATARYDQLYDMLQAAAGVNR